ncbi:enoyl-CoA hydratase/isomerase family protein [Flavitalea flava]
MYTTLLTGLSDHIFTITINRPDKLNALNKAVMSELDEVISEVYENREIKSAIITGAGPKAFVAGADISEFLGLSQEEGQALSKKGHDIFFRIENSPKPIVAAVNGFALGGGNELAMACHLRFCSANAKFGQPEVNLGLIPGYGGTQRLTQLIGKGKALELMLSAAVIDAQEALRLGLVGQVTSAEELLSKTREFLLTIQAKAPVAVARIIECVNIAAGSPAASAASPSSAEGAKAGNGFILEQQAFGECFATEDMKEGAAAFLEKRKPVFTGK